MTNQRDPPTGSIPPEILYKILSCLPLASVLNFRYVSKSWLKLIQDHLREKTISSPVVAFLYCKRSSRKYIGHSETISADADGDVISKYLSPSFFLQFSLKFTHCCNGLILATSTHTGNHIVCNPAMNSWIELPKLKEDDRLCIVNFARLEFDPRISPYSRVVSFYGEYCWSIYSSRTGRWRHGYRESLLSRVSKHLVTMWKGDVYWIRQSRHPCNTWLVKGFPNIMSKLPTAAAMCYEDEMCLGWLAGCPWLCVGNLKKSRLMVWSYRGEDAAGGEWVLEHQSTIASLPPSQEISQALSFQFHPRSRAVFIRRGEVVYSYDLEKTVMEETCRIGRGDKVAFPFTPLLYD